MNTEPAPENPSDALTVEKLEAAFVQYVNDSHAGREERKFTKALGCCKKCGLTYYESEFGGFYHFTHRGTNCDGLRGMKHLSETPSK